MNALSTTDVALMSPADPVAAPSHDRRMPRVPHGRRLLELPDDILLTLLQRYCPRRDCARFARIDKRALPLARSVLYTRLVIPSLRALPHVLHTLHSSSATIAPIVHELVFAASSVDPIQALGPHHAFATAEVNGRPSTPQRLVDGAAWPLVTWIHALVDAAPAAWHVDVSQVALPVFSLLCPQQAISHELWPLLTSRKMTLSVPWGASLLGNTALNAAAGQVLGLERVDFAHAKCTAIVSLGAGREHTSSPTSSSSAEPAWPRAQPTARFDCASCPAGGVPCSFLNGIVGQNFAFHSATRSIIHASDPADVDTAIKLAPRARMTDLALSDLDPCCVDQLTKRILTTGGHLASLVCLTLTSVTVPITSLLAAAAVHLPLLHSLTLINLHVPLEPTLVTVDCLVRRPHRPLRKLKIVGIFDYLPSDSAAHFVPIPPSPFPPTESAPRPALTHLILHRKSPYSNAPHQSQTARVRPRVLLSRLLVPTLRVLSVNDLDIVLPRDGSDTPTALISLLHPNVRGPLAPFVPLFETTFPSLCALRLDVQARDLEGNMLPRAAPRLECLVAQNLAGDFSRAVAVVDLLAAYPCLTHVWLDKNLWLPIAQVQKLGQVLFSPRPSGPRPRSPSAHGPVTGRKRSPGPPGPRNRLMRDTLPHLERIVVDNAHAQCLVGGTLSLPLELPSPPPAPARATLSPVDDNSLVTATNKAMAGLRLGAGGSNGNHPHAYGGTGFVDDLSQEPHGFRPVPLDTAMQYREWMEQVYELI